MAVERPQSRSSASQPLSTLDFRAAYTDAAARIVRRPLEGLDHSERLDQPRPAGPARPSRSRARRPPVPLQRRLPPGSLSVYPASATSSALLGRISPQTRSRRELCPDGNRLHDLDGRNEIEVHQVAERSSCFKGRGRGLTSATNMPPTRRRVPNGLGTRSPRRSPRQKALQPGSLLHAGVELVAACHEHDATPCCRELPAGRYSRIPTDDLIDVDEIGSPDAIVPAALGWLQEILVRAEQVCPAMPPRR